MTTRQIPDGPIETPPNGFAPSAEQRQVLLDVLAEAGFELGAYDLRLVEWLAGWDWSTVATIASWIKRAGAAANGKI